MKKILILFYLLPFFVLGQHGALGDKQHHPGAMWYFDGLRPPKNADIRKYDRLVFDVTYNTLNGDYLLFSNRLPSLGMNVSLLFDVPMTKQNTVSFAWGLGYGFSTLDIKDKLTPQNGNYQFTPLANNENYNRNFLRTHRFFVPLELRFRSKGWRHVKFVVGVNFGVQPGLREVFVSSSGDEVTRSHVRLIDNAFWTYGVHARLGTRNLAVFGAYQFSSMFKSSQNLKLYPLQLGLSLSLF